MFVDGLEEDKHRDEAEEQAMLISAKPSSARGKCST
jgi:hypothetical protein